MDPEKFYKMLSDKNTLLEFLTNLGLINLNESLTCQKCNIAMNVRFRKRKDNDFSFLARCNKCKNETSLLKNTFFSTNKTGSVSQKLSCKKILKLIFQYFEKKTHDEIMRNCDIKNATTVVNWTNYIRDIINFDLNNLGKLGGEGKRVQVDESLFRGRRKYHRGRFLLGDVDAETESDRSLRRANYGTRVNGPWVVGLVEEGSERLRMFIVEKRDSQTLNSIILENVENETVVVTDGWTGYSTISQYGFNHEVVIHEENFLDPISGANTQRIECEWGHAKLLIMRLRRGTTMNLLQSHLDEFCFRRLYGINVFEKWLISSIFFNY